MTIQWSGFTNHLRIGVDVWTDGYDTYTPSINVYYAVYVQCDGSWNFNDSQTAVLSGSRDGSWTFQNTLGANGTVQVGSGTIYGQGQNYGGGPTYVFSLVLNGVYLGAGPSGTFYFTLPARPTRAPSAPGAPFFASASGSFAQVTFADSSDYGGLNPDFYPLQVALDAGFSAVFYSVNGPRTQNVSGMAPGRTYYMRAGAHNGSGWSPWSATGISITSAYPNVAPSATVGPDSATVSWQAPYPGDQYQGFDVQVATDSGFTNVVQNPTAPGNATSVALTGLTPGTAYYFRVRAIPMQNLGYGSWSPTGTASTLSAAKVMRGGRWVNGIVYARKNGVWTVAKVNKRNAGAWHL